MTMRYLGLGVIAALVVAAVVIGVVLVARDGEGRAAPVSTLVSGRTFVDGTPGSAEVFVYQSALPLADFVSQFEEVESLAGGTSEVDGTFTITSDVVEDPSAGRLIVLASCYGVLTSCHRRGCEWRELPSLRLVRGQWAVTPSGQPLRMTFRIRSQEPGLC